MVFVRGCAVSGLSPESNKSDMLVVSVAGWGARAVFGWGPTACRGTTRWRPCWRLRWRWRPRAFSLALTAEHAGPSAQRTPTQGHSGGRLIRWIAPRPGINRRWSAHAARRNGSRLRLLFHGGRRPVSRRCARRSRALVALPAPRAWCAGAQRNGRQRAGTAATDDLPGRATRWCAHAASGRQRTRGGRRHLQTSTTERSGWGSGAGPVRVVSPHLV
mmetsp:Transcript_86472/g.197277  ORF Transcript_86472/g.197277 Transcript_86472/m.197277 type:complete len:217 (+) Transcript_86472:777-1427(+)